MSWPSWMPLRPQLRELSAYGAPQINVPVRLNTNENPYSLSERMQKALDSKLRESLATLNRYPDRDAIELRSELAKLITESTGLNLNLSQVWAANGSNEIIQSIALAFEGDAMGFEPSYSMHPLISRSVGKRWISIQRNKDFEIDLPSAKDAIAATDAKLIFLTTPNNPTGNCVATSTIVELARAALDVGALLIVDEAYGEFSNEQSAVHLLSDHPNVIVSRTMSKAFAFAGARLGYLIANPKIVEAMQLVRLPYHLSTLTQAAALAALSLRNELAKDVIDLRNSREALADELIELGLKVYPSQANFLLFTGFELSEKKLWENLVEQGVLIRDVGIPAHLRVTVGTRAENRAFVTALAKVIRG